MDAHSPLPPRLSVKELERQLRRVRMGAYPGEELYVVRQSGMWKLDTVIPTPR